MPQLRMTSSRAVLALLDDVCHVAGEDRRQRVEHRHAVIRQVVLATERGSAGADAVEIAPELLMCLSRCWGPPNYTYAEARWSEALPEWIGAHVNAFTAIGGVPGGVVCDNLKAGVTATCRYEPGINRTHQDLATHYDAAILPTRPRKPRDKAKVEVAVLIIERYVLARLRNRRFFSLFELNAAIREIVADLNARIMRKLGVSRLELLETVERPALKELPSEPYQYAEWKKCRVAPDYHVEVERHYYSVPSRLIREQ